MEKIILGWLDIWLYFILIVGILNILLLVKNYKKYTTIQILSVCAGVTLALHAWEEWAIPGGFGFIYNNGSLVYPMNRLTDMLTIFMGVMAVTIIHITWAYRLHKNKPIDTAAINRIGICVFLISAIEVLMHFVGGFRYLDTYGFYNPGLATSLVLFLPISVLFIRAFIKAKPTKKDWIIGIASMVIVFLVMIILPEALFKDPNTPYGFLDAGWYEQFIK